jgi:ferritin-like metal-binding protein YciE
MIIPMLFSLAKKWIDRKNSPYSDETFDRMAQAFIKHKKETERRLQNLEAIVTDDGPATKRSKSPNKKKEKKPSAKTIEIDSDSSEKDQKKDNSESGNLRNMLNK